MKFYQLSKRETESAFEANLATGLNEGDVKKRLKSKGYNELAEGESPSLLIVFFQQFKDFMVLVLLIATLVSGLLGEYIDAITIIAIVILNALLGFFQEVRAEKSLAALKEMAAPQVLVLRDKKWQKIATKDVVPGDVLRLKSGDIVGADLRLVEANSLEIEESSLTGESLPVLKKNGKILADNLSIGDMKNMAFKGSLVTRGNGIGIVVATGMETAMGQIANLIQSSKAAITPLQRRLEQLGKILILTALVLTVLVVVIGIIQGQEFYLMVLAGVSLAVAAIPEGLPAIVTVSLSLGVQRMIKQNSIVRKLSAVETLGCASVICSDKTGTMTENKMTVRKIWSAKQVVNVATRIKNGHNYFSSQNKSELEQDLLFKILSYSVLCNNAELTEKMDKIEVVGDPTEGSLLVAAMKAKISRQKLAQDFELIKEFPFDSKRKMMTVVLKMKNGRYLSITKGAPDILMKNADTIDKGSEVRLFQRAEYEEVNNAVTSFASEALRTIAVAYKELDNFREQDDEAAYEKDFTFLSVIGMIDPPRPEVKEAVMKCRDAGIKTIMITGDHLITAKTIAQQLKVFSPGDKLVTGEQLSTMSQRQLENLVEDVTVFARVSPEDKLRIVTALQAKGHIVAMTGDGVNDAPAIKTANIGIAMGITGTEVTKEAADLILVDDNFATIKSAIEEGRNIYDNIRKFIRYLLASNVGEILVMLFAMILAYPLPLVPIQILWVNLVTDGLPALALGLDKPEANVMKQKPRDPKESIFARGLGWKIISRGFLIGIVTLIAFIVVYNRNSADLVYAQTIAFSTLVLAQLIHVFDCRSENSILARNPVGNPQLVFAVASSMFLLLLAVYYPPLQPIFHTKAILMHDWLLISALAAIPTFLLIGTSFVRKEG